MDFFDSLIKEVDVSIENCKKSAYCFNESKQWADLGYNQVILQRETAFELNGTGFSLLTSSDIVDEVVIVGSDVSSISSSTSCFNLSLTSLNILEPLILFVNLSKSFLE